MVLSDPPGGAQTVKNTHFSHFAEFMIFLVFLFFLFPRNIFIQNAGFSEKVRTSQKNFKNRSKRPDGQKYLFFYCFGALFSSIFMLFRKFTKFHYFHENR